MRAIVFALYGVVSYAIFLAVFVYAIAFVGDLPVPKTINSGAPGPLIPSLALDGLLLGQFALQHSVMARPGFKRWWTRFVPPPVERSTFVLFASLSLAAVCAFWQPLTLPIWSVEEPVARAALGVLFWAGWGIVLLSTFLINHFELFGLKQVWDRLRRRNPSATGFRTPFFYRWVRHPLYLGFVVAFWATPDMTLGRFIFAAGTLAWMLIAIQLEERDLVDVFGDRYRDYRRDVGMLLPKIGRREPTLVGGEVKSKL